MAEERKTTAEERKTMPHNIIMENRKRLMLTGVREVDSFDDETVILSTGLGGLTVRGASLHIDHFDADSGELTMNGTVYALVYTTDKAAPGGFLKRIFQ